MVSVILRKRRVELRYEDYFLIKFLFFFFGLIMYTGIILFLCSGIFYNKRFTVF